MTFFEQVKSIQESVLNLPKYSVPVKEMYDKTNEYVAERKIDEKLNSKSEQEEELTI